MAFMNQGGRPNYISSQDPIAFKARTQNLDKTHGDFIADSIAFMTEIRPEDFNAPRALWERVFDAGAKDRFVENVSGHWENCSDKEIIKRQIAIFREVSDDLADRLEKASGIKGYPGIADLTFLGTHNGMGSKRKLANGMKEDLSVPKVNGAPVAKNIAMNGLAHGNGIAAR